MVDPGDGRTLVAVDTRSRVAKLDGRFPHWVRGYRGERFSVVVFSAQGRAARGEVVKGTRAAAVGAVHEDWMPAATVLEGSTVATKRAMPFGDD